VCSQPFSVVGRRRFCSDACRQAAYRRRLASTVAVAPTGAGTIAAVVVYECPACEERHLERRCPDCNLFCRRLGSGGRCPHCDEIVAVSDLVGD